MQPMFSGGRFHRHIVEIKHVVEWSHTRWSARWLVKVKGQPGNIVHEYSVSRLYDSNGVAVRAFWNCNHAGTFHLRRIC